MLSGQAALLGIDLGTSSVKAVVTDLSGSVISQASGDYVVNHPQPGWAETDPAGWLSATRTAVRAAVDTAAADIRAVGLSGQMHGVVPTSATGEPVRDAMLWSDARAISQLAGYAQLPDEARARLANPVTPGMAGPLLLWLKVHRPDEFRQMRWALQPKDWLRAQLTGTFSAEPSDASATLLYDIYADSWDADVIEHLGLDHALFPELLPSAGDIAGHLTDSAANFLGLPADLPVAAGAGDTAAAALGSGLHDPGTAQLTIGTGAQVIRPIEVLPARTTHLAPVTHVYRAATRHGWYGLGAVASAGSTLTWVRQILAAPWDELYAAAALAPAADDPIFLPHLNGERTPYLDTAMRGAWVGLSPLHDRRTLLRTALEGVAFAIRSGLEALLAASPVDDVRLAGGGSTAAAWRQMLADVLGRAMHPVTVSAASGRGAALLGGCAAGLITEAELWSGVPMEDEPPVVNDAGRSATYGERYARYLEVVATLRRLDR